MTVTAAPAGDADVARIAALIGDRARARVMMTLLDGRALPAGVLAVEAGVAASTISAHLARLVDAELLTAERQGRARYFRLAGSSVAEALEAIARISPPEPIRSLRQGTRAHALRRARTCYNHLAGRLGVTVMAGLLERGILTGGDGQHHAESAGRDRLSAPGSDLTYGLTHAGRRELTGFGLDLAAVERQRPPVLPGLVRAATPSRRAARHGTDQPAARPGLDPARHPAADRPAHRSRPGRPARRVRCARGLGAGAHGAPAPGRALGHPSLGGQVARCVAGVHGAARFDEDDLGSVDRHGLVRDSPRYDVQLSGSELDVPVLHPDAHRSAHDQEELVGVRMAVPGELTAHLDHPYVVVVHDGHRPRRPGLPEGREDGSKVHGAAHARTMPRGPWATGVG